MAASKKQEGSGKMFDGVASSHMAFAAAMVDMMRSKEPNEKKEPKKAAAPAAFDPELLARLAQQANEVPEEPPEPDPPEPPPPEPEPPPPSFNLPPGFTVVTFDTETEAQQAMAEMGEDDIPLGEAESNSTPAIGFGRGWTPVGQEPEGPEKTEKVRNIVDNVMGTLKATAASSLAASKVAPPAAKPTHTRPLASAAVPAADLYLPGGTRGVGATVIGQTDAKDSQADKDGARDRRDDRGGDNSDRRYRSRSRGGRRSRSNRRGGRSRSNRRDGGRQRGRWSRSPRRAEPAKPRRNTGFTSAPADPSQAPYHAPSPAPSPAPPIGKAFEEVAGLLNISVQELKAHREIYLYNRRSVTDDHVKELARNCVNLEKIGLTSTKVTDAGVQEVATHCPQLHTIYLTETKVTDQGVQEIAQHCHNLKEIWLNGTKVTDAGVQELKAKIPNITVYH